MKIVEMLNIKIKNNDNLGIDIILSNQEIMGLLDEGERFFILESLFTSGFTSLSDKLLNNPKFWQDISPTYKEDILKYLCQKKSTELISKLITHPKFLGQIGCSTKITLIRILCNEDLEDLTYILINNVKFWKLEESYIKPKLLELVCQAGFINLALKLLNEPKFLKDLTPFNKTEIFAILCENGLSQEANKLLNDIEFWRGIDSEDKVNIIKSVCEAGFINTANKLFDRPKFIQNIHDTYLKNCISKAINNGHLLMAISICERFKKKNTDFLNYDFINFSGYLAFNIIHIYNNEELENICNFLQLNPKLSKKLGFQELTPRGLRDYVTAKISGNINLSNEYRKAGQRYFGKKSIQNYNSWVSACKPTEFGIVLHQENEHGSITLPTDIFDSIGNIMISNKEIFQNWRQNILISRINLDNQNQLAK